jgi:hypothetical protein
MAVSNFETEAVMGSLVVMIEHPAAIRRGFTDRMIEAMAKRFCLDTLGFKARVGDLEIGDSLYMARLWPKRRQRVMPGCEDVCFWYQYMNGLEYMMMHCTCDHSNEGEAEFSCVSTPRELKQAINEQRRHHQAQKKLMASTTPSAALYNWPSAS